MTKPRLILVVGLGHSGTTILDSALGCAPELVGVGEALRMLDPRRAASGEAWQKLRTGPREDLACTCGRSAADCPVWSRMALADGRGVTVDYPLLHASALAAKPGAVAVVDSTPGGDAYLDALEAFDVRAIHITRDARSWAASWARRKDRPAWTAFHHWRKGTRKIAAALDARGIPRLTLGYEEFALRPEAALRVLCDRLGTTFVPAMLSPYGATGSHIVSGNRAVKDPARASSISYDGSWMAVPGRPLLEGLMFARVAAENRALVYSNGIIRQKV
ncbi:MAG: sulfotransferase [Amaricoccus sp.]